MGAFNDKQTQRLQAKARAPVNRKKNRKTSSPSPAPSPSPTCRSKASRKTADVKAALEAKTVVWLGHQAFIANALVGRTLETAGVKALHIVDSIPSLIAGNQRTLKLPGGGKQTVRRFSVKSSQRADYPGLRLVTQTRYNEAQGDAALAMRDSCKHVSFEVPHCTGKKQQTPSTIAAFALPMADGRLRYTAPIVLTMTASRAKSLVDMSPALIESVLGVQLAFQPSCSLPFVFDCPPWDLTKEHVPLLLQRCQPTATPDDVEKMIEACRVQTALPRRSASPSSVAGDSAVASLCSSPTSSWAPSSPSSSNAEGFAVSWAPSSPSSSNAEGVPDGFAVDDIFFDGLDMGFATDAAPSSYVSPAAGPGGMDVDLFGDAPPPPLYHTAPFDDLCRYNAAQPVNIGATPPANVAAPASAFSGDSIDVGSESEKWQTLLQGMAAVPFTPSAAADTFFDMDTLVAATL